MSVLPPFGLEGGTSSGLGRFSRCTSGLGSISTTVPLLTNGAQRVPHRSLPPLLFSTFSGFYMPETRYVPYKSVYFGVIDGGQGRFTQGLTGSIHIENLRRFPRLVVLV